MIKNYFLKVITFISFCCLINAISNKLLFAQRGIQGTQSHEIRWMSVGGLRSWFDNFGSEGEYFRRDWPTYVSQDQIDGLCWPNEYSARMKGVKISKGLWIGTSNFNDPVTNITYPHKVIGTGPISVYTGTEIIADESFGDIGISMIGKFSHPAVYVDNVDASVRNEDDEIDQEDPSISSDRIIINKFHTSIGVTVTRKIIASSQQYNDNYYIYEYTFKNTGIIDESGEQKLNETLTDVIFYFIYRYSFAGESYTGKGKGDWFPATSSWGRNTIYDQVGQDENHRLVPPNDFRAMISYYGPMSMTFFGSPEGDIGLPGPNAANVQTLAGTQFGGIVVLHADTNPGNSADDISQPSTTYFQGSDEITRISNSSTDQYDPSQMSLKYSNFMTAGHTAFTHAEQVGKNENGWPNGYANTFGADPGGYSATQGFGPYTLAPGDSICIVLAEAVAGINHEKILEVAKNWFENNTSEFILPKGYKDGGITSDRNEYKNALVFSGKDSLFQTFRRAIANYSSNYNIPQPPPPPENFTVNSDADKISLSWSNNAELWPNFNGYRIFRAEGRTDTTFEKIFECDKNSVVHSFDDITAVRGFNYYYYIQSKDDGSTNTGDPNLNIPAGEPLVSSKYYTMTNKPAAYLPLNIGDIYSHQSGDWNDVNSWEQYNGSTWVYPAPHIPNNYGSSVTILSGHTITVSAHDTVKQLNIPGGTLIINKDAILYVKNGNDTNVVVNGTIKNLGLITKDNSALIQFGEHSKYFHHQDGGIIPIAIWDIGSICQFDSIKSTVPLNINQNFYNFIWDCPNQSNDINLGWNNIILHGVINIKNTGSGELQLCSPAEDSTASITINGDVIQTGGQFTANGSNNPNTSVGINQDGNINITGGNFSISSGSQGGLGTTRWHLFGDDFSISNAIIQNSNQAGAKFIFAHSGIQTLTLGEGYNIISLPIEVFNGSTFSLGNKILEGSGSFTLDTGATIEITQAGGLDSTIKTTGEKFFSKGANYTFKGSAAQLTGNSVPDTVNNLTIENEEGITLSSNIVVNGTLEMKRGGISSGNNSLSYGANGTLKYSGLFEQTTTDAEFPVLNGPKNVTVANPIRTILHASRIVPGILSLSNPSGGILVLNSNNLIVDSIFTYSSAYIETNGTGALKLTSSTWQRLLPVGTSTGYAPVWIRNAGDIDTISVSVMDDNTKAVGGGRVKAKWRMSEMTQGDGNYTLRFGWLPSMEDSVFKTDWESYARIFRLLDTTEVGTGPYSRTGAGDHRVRRGGITLLDTFVVGYFTGLTDVNKYELGIPTKFSLSQNYPNPFNPSTRIRYEIPSESKVLIKVYDILGREVMTLINDYQKPGRYEVEWNAENLASGVYFYSIKAGDFSAVRKLVLVK